MRVTIYPKDGKAVKIVVYSIYVDKDTFSEENGIEEMEISDDEE